MSSESEIISFLIKKWACTPKRGRMIALLNITSHMRPVQI